MKTIEQRRLEDRLRYAANRERILKRQRQYYHDHREEKCEKAKKYRINNRAARASIEKKWRDNNKEKVRLAQRLWHEKNPAYYTERRNNDPSVLDKERQYRMQNRERLSEYRRQYIQSNRKKINARAKAYYKLHPDLKWDAKYPEKAKARSRNWMRKQITELSDEYVKAILIQGKSLKFSDLPAELVEVKRLHLELQREKRRQQ